MTDLTRRQILTGGAKALAAASAVAVIPATLFDATESTYGHKTVIPLFVNGERHEAEVEWRFDGRSVLAEFDGAPPRITIPAQREPYEVDVHCFVEVFPACPAHRVQILSGPLVPAGEVATLKFPPALLALS